MNVKAVLFDLGGTLIETPEISEIMQHMLEENGILRSLEEIDNARKAAEVYLGGYKDLPILRDEFWIRWNIVILKNLGVRNNLETLAMFIAESWWDYAQAKLYPEVRKVLQKLREKGCKLGVVTNGLKSDADKILPQVGSTNAFDIVVVIDSVGKMKPDKEIFLCALNQLKTKPHEALFIGDRIEEDYGGAENAGMKALLIDRENKTEENIDKIQSLEEIFEKLDM
jgi:putative hydrolase of the HAD superfamily